MADPFLDLQNGFYNAFSQGLGFSPNDPFQIIQPSPSLPSGPNADTMLWNYFNNIPPLSLTQNIILSGGNQFLSDYVAVMAALEAQPNNFKSTIGDACFTAWMNYLNSNPRMYTIPINQYPMVFRNWAMNNSTCSQVAISGASAYAAALLDPIFAAQNALLPYQPTGAAPVNFDPGYDTMMQQLLTAPGRKFEVATGQWNHDVRQTWTKGSDSAFFGLFGGSSSSSSLSQKFASSGVSMSASFGNVLQFSATPGNWYNSGAFGMAFNNKSGVPWNSQSPVNWDNTFGTKGNMQRFMTTLVIVNQMCARVTSMATYSEDEQSEIRQDSSNGIWPFYSKTSDSGTNTDVGFNEQGQMTVTFSSQNGVPIVVGGVVVPVATYLGHEDEASQIHMARLNC
jgi:hypothetical protein